MSLKFKFIYPIFTSKKNFKLMKLLTISVVQKEVCNKYKLIIVIFSKESSIIAISNIYTIENTKAKRAIKAMDNLIYFIVMKLLELLNNFALTSSILFFLTKPLSNPACEVCDAFSSSNISSFLSP